MLHLLNVQLRKGSIPDANRRTGSVAIKLVRVSIAVTTPARFRLVVG